MDLKEKLQNILERKYGIETQEDLFAALEEMEVLDLGIFVTSQKQEHVA